MMRETPISKELPGIISAVLLDYDGVIADTMKDNDRAWKRAFVHHGVTLGETEYLELEGMTPLAIATFLVKKYNLPESLTETIVTDKAEYYRQDNQFRLYPGVIELVRSLKGQGIKLALVSGAARHRIEEMTPRELLDLFDVVITADDKVQPKPDPEPYTSALEKLDVPANETVVIENAPLGIQSAKAAGCFCIAIETTLSCGTLAGADMILSDHKLLVEQFSK